MPDEQVFEAMEAEMERSKGLRREGSGPPYFLAYRLTDIRTLDVSASFGAVTAEDSEESRVLYVEARVGSRQLDNTDRGYRGWHGLAGKEPGALRARLWSLTDKAYKSAVSGLLEKKAKRATELVVDELDDFSVEVSTVFAAPQAVPDIGRDRLAKIVEEASRVFRDYPFVYESHASAAVRWSRRYLMTSEGARLATEGSHMPGLIRVTAMTRASDGMRLDNTVSFRFRGAADLPSPRKVARAARRLASELGRARRAPLQPPVSAPMILSPEVTSVLLHEALGHKLEGLRQRDPNQSQVFKDLVGTSVMPEHLSLVDDPTMASFRGESLSGHYRFDSEGVAAQRVVLVERGTLRHFLMSRWPIKGFDRSNGHGRSDPFRHPTGRMANLIVKAHHPVGADELVKRLRKLCRPAGKPYGFLLVGSFGGENPNSRRSAQTLEVLPRLIFRVDAGTGRKTLVRGVKMVGTPLTLLRRIVAAGDDVTLSNGLFCGAESGNLPMGHIAPSVLLSEAELQRLPEDRQVGPILKSPFGHGKGRGGTD